MGCTNTSGQPSTTPRPPALPPLSPPSHSRPGSPPPPLRQPVGGGKFHAPAASAAAALAAPEATVTAGLQQSPSKGAAATAGRWGGAPQPGRGSSQGAEGGANRSEFESDPSHPPPPSTGPRAGPAAEHGRRRTHRPLLRPVRQRRTATADTSDAGRRPQRGWGGWGGRQEGKTSAVCDITHVTPLSRRVMGGDRDPTSLPCLSGVQYDWTTTPTPSIGIQSATGCIAESPRVRHTSSRRQPRVAHSRWRLSRLSHPPMQSPGWSRQGPSNTHRGGWSRGGGDGGWAICAPAGGRERVEHIGSGDGVEPFGVLLAGHAVGCAPDWPHRRVPPLLAVLWEVPPVFAAPCTAGGEGANRLDPRGPRQQLRTVPRSR